MKLTLLETILKYGYHKTNNEARYNYRRHEYNYHVHGLTEYFDKDFW